MAHGYSPLLETSSRKTMSKVPGERQSVEATIPHVSHGKLLLFRKIHMQK